MDTNRFLQLSNQKQAKLTRLRALLDGAEGRQLSRRERAEADDLEAEIERLTRELPSFDPRLAQPTQLFTDTADGDGVLRPEQRMSDWMRAHGHRGGLDGLDEPERYSFGKLLRGAITGDWRDAEPEQRALSVSSLADGGYLVPTPLSGTMIDRLRNNMAVMKAGATTVPLTAETTYLARLATGATVTWKAEGAAISESSPGFERVTMTAHTLPIVVRLSVELFEDLSPEANNLLEHEVALALSLELDRACLRGSGIGAEPTGVVNQPGVTLTSLGPNGSVVSGWDTAIDAVSVVRSANAEPTGILWSSRTEQTHNKLKTSVGSYVDPPAGIAAIPRYTTNQIPNTLHVGSSTDCSEIYVGRWSDLLVGIRTDLRFQVRVLDQRYIDNLEYGLLCYLRADVQLAHPAAFNVVTGVRQ